MEEREGMKGINCYIGGGSTHYVFFHDLYIRSKILAAKVAIYEKEDHKVGKIKFIIEQQNTLSVTIDIKDSTDETKWLEMKDNLKWLMDKIIEGD